MKHYQKVKPTERLILKALVAKDDNPEITEAFSRALDFFDSYDKVEHTVHAEVMRKIYLNNNCYKYSNSTHGLPRKTGVPSRTLCRYRKKIPVVSLHVLLPPDRQRIHRQHYELFYTVKTKIQ